MAVAVFNAGCASFYPVEKTPEGITQNVQPGDTVRVVSADADEVRVLVTAINDHEIRGRIDGKREAPVRLRFDRIETLQVQRLNMRKALLAVVLPVVVATIVVCAQQDCRSGGALNARL